MKTLPIFLLALSLGLLFPLGCGDPGSYPEKSGRTSSSDAAPPSKVPDLEPPNSAVTQFGATTELFVEFPALVTGRSWPFAVHLTRLDSFLPLGEGRVEVILRGGGSPEEVFVQDGPSKPGYFRCVVAPQHEGRRELLLRVRAKGLEDSHVLGAFSVYPSIQAAIEGESKSSTPGDAIPFSKEQQWKLDFRLDKVVARTLRPSLRVPGVLRARHKGEAWVSAPQEGRLLAGEGELPHLGVQVEEGELLAVLAVPLREAAGDPATLALAVERAQLEFRAADRELGRLEKLFAKGAIPERRVVELRSRKDKAWAELDAAKRRLKNFEAQQRSEGEGAAGRIELRAPISGTVVECRAIEGTFVDPGEELIHIVDRGQIWLEASVPESKSSQVQEVSGAWFEIEGSEKAFEVTEETGGHLVATGALVDPRTRTFPVLFEFPNPDPSLRIGMFAKVHLLLGSPRESVAIPVEALVEEEGKQVAYVQLGGESFERRVLRLGIRDGGFVEVQEGLEAGEILVTRGAYFVRLAAAGGAVPSHGHAH